MFLFIIYKFFRSIIISIFRKNTFSYIRPPYVFIHSFGFVNVSQNPPSQQSRSCLLSQIKGFNMTSMYQTPDLIISTLASQLLSGRRIEPSIPIRQYNLLENFMQIRFFQKNNKICCLYSARQLLHVAVINRNRRIFDIFIPIPNSSISFEIPNIYTIPVY